MADTGLALADPQLSEEAGLRAHRDLVHAVEGEMRKLEPRQIAVKHHFADGVYAREVFLPAGTLATGRIHKFSQVNIISQGEISVLTEHGTVHLCAPATVVSPPGTKRLVYAHTDTVWTTIIHTHETDTDTIVEKLTVPTEEEYARCIEQQQGKLVEIA